SSQPLADRRKIRHGLLWRDASLQSTDDLQEIESSLIPDALRGQPDGREHFSLNFCRKPKTRGQNSHNRERPAIQDDCFSDRRGIGSKATLPQSVTEQSDRLSPRAVLFGKKNPALGWSNIQERK